MSEVIVEHPLNPWRLQFLGHDPEAEARLLRILCTQALNDERVMAEFGSTVEAYIGDDTAAIAQRIEARYAGGQPEMICAVGFIDDQPAGMGFVGLMDFKVAERAGKGLNVSGWLLGKYRGRGMGAWALMQIVDRAAVRVRDEADPMFGAFLWTSVLNGNKPSQHLVQRNHYAYAGPDGERPYRSIYMRPLV